MRKLIRPPRVLRRRPLLVVATVALAGFITWCPAAAAASHAGCGMVHVGPELAQGAPAASYFKVTIKPGSTARLALIAANPERYACGVQVFAAYGKTATNSGDTYPVVSSRRSCVRTACWLSALPARVEVAAHQRVLVQFTVRVPPGTGPGQYLAGVVAGPSTPPAVQRTKVGRAQVSAAVVAHVAIGVAIEVPGRLQPVVSIPTVTLSATPEAAVLQITERNSGNTWEHPEGTVKIATHRRVATDSTAAADVSSHAKVPTAQTFAIQSRTLLPHDSAALPLAIGPIPRGTWPTEVALWYDHHRKLAIWRGRISYPGPAADRRSGAGGTGSSSDVPLWAKLLIGGLAAASLALASLVLILIGKRRRREAEA